MCGKNNCPDKDRGIYLWSESNCYDCLCAGLYEDPENIYIINRLKYMEKIIDYNNSFDEVING